MVSNGYSCNKPMMQPFNLLITEGLLASFAGVTLLWA